MKHVFERKTKVLQIQLIDFDQNTSRRAPTKFDIMYMLIRD